MNYAKLIDGTLVPAPRKLRNGDYVTYNPPVAMLEEHGFKPVRHTDPPEVEEGFVAVPGWEETEEEIVQTWTVEPEGDISDAEALEILMGGAQ